MNIVEINLKNANDKIEFDSIMYNLYFDFNYIDVHNTIDFNNLNTAFILKSNNDIVARIALFNGNDSNIKFFGHFEALNLESGVELLNHVIKFIKEKDIKNQLIGPINGTTWYPYRIALNNEHSLFSNDLCQASYYSDVLESCGLIKKEIYYTNIQTNFISRNIPLKSEFKIRTLNHEELKSKAKEIHEITMKAFQHSPFFTPLPYEVFEQQFLKQLHQINHELSPFILDSNGNICAYSSCYESNNGEGIVVKTIARRLERQFAGLGRILSNEISSIATGKNYKFIMHAFMHQNNKSKILSEKFNGIPLKTYALYQTI